MPQLSGPTWVARFPTSTSTADLTPTFRSAVDSFLAALRDAGAGIIISATLRPPERAHLMHYAWRIARESLDPQTVPARAGVDIDRVHRTPAGLPDLNGSRAAAEQMVVGYDIAVRPSLTSRHTEGRAIDMNISWTGNLVVTEADGTTATISTTPRNGMNTELHNVGAGYGVRKLVSDPPHWSDDGH